MKKFILSIFVFFLGINICNAVQTYDRNTLDNYGVNKDIKVTEENLNNVLRAKAVDVDLKIYDFAGILTDSEIEELRKMALDFYDETGFDLVIVTDSFYNLSDVDNYAYAQDFYDYNDFGIDDKYYSGVLILRNAYPDYPYYSIRSFGEAQLYFSGKRTDTMLDDTSGFIARKEYAKAFTSVINYLNDYYEDGISSEFIGYKIDKNGALVAPYKLPLLIALIISGLFTFFYISYFVKRNKMVFKAKLAYDYLDKGSVHYRVRENQFLHSSTRTIHKSTSSGGGSGGGSHGSFRGSSGRSSSGGGRRV